MSTLKVGAQHYNVLLLWSGKKNSKIAIFNTVAAWKNNVLMKTPFRDEKVKQKIERIFRIWEQRSVYNEEFLADLHGLLSINPTKKPQPNENDDEQVATTIASIKNCIKLEKETDRSFKSLPKAPLGDQEAIANLKGNVSYSHYKSNVLYLAEFDIFSSLFA